MGGCELMVLNQERLSPDQEVVLDLVTIVDQFSSRLEGLKESQNKLNEKLKNIL
jgi:predicted site-specific integrase-resolvase